MRENVKKILKTTMVKKVQNQKQAENLPKSLLLIRKRNLLIKMENLQGDVLMFVPCVIDRGILINLKNLMKKYQRMNLYVKSFNGKVLNFFVFSVTWNV